MIKGRKIKIAIVGCGRISKNHFGSIEQLENEFELVAVCDNNHSVLQAHKEQYKVPGYLSLDELLEKEAVDIISLCTPSGLHSRQAIRAAKSGVHVISEKPMATKWDDGLAMLKACDDAGVRLFVVKQNRRNSTLRLLKRAVSEKRFGKIHMVHVNVFWTRPQEYYDRAAWSGTWDMDGGAFMNQATHYVDLLHWLIGPVEKVHAITSTHRDIDVEDTGVVNIKWRNGAVGSMAVTMCTYPKNYEGSITILGEKGTVRVGGVAVNEIQDWIFDEEKDYDSQITDANYQTTSVYGFGHPPYFKNVADVLRGKAEPETDGREGLKSLELLIATYRSARDGKEMGLPLNL
ncbi:MULTISPECIES: Gfo/Idh/MocA family protein [Plesiomonas]|uniref:Gfo/Idh/MocA family oxidoreductase n=1 Tax=Plesiomonas shigelloides TaxID=703 RepID=A0A4D6U7V4_PLESH|nr:MULTISPECIES: Gfo/Idh/MocA family oxidoreductase [Plesiomonas]KAB7684934.1 gfo/Idh/MocA family oxidoreductase [Plesiomonas shigelloides]KAB7690940.1 gfo/Idh/MocA family oxidoreductase [Plesiomonas shigelloides]MCE5164962.1 Gfo/Idh/MocA family oxidoreductase [Plesiomonas sp. PI-19]MCQ8858395.1 Gfo/Idh/MocA family oxidoreductase [Plesiomonas shigelloides]QCH03257.1 Gfo/Idh/MocA family oxidoreductase [Plesiomonas shigelloides]